MRQKFRYNELEIQKKGRLIPMNETIQNILARRSVRCFKTEMPKAEDLELIIRCGEYAATGMGIQPWHFTVVRNAALLKEASEASRSVMLASPDELPRQIASAPDFDCWHGAPAAIIVSAKDGEAYAMADCANATQNMAIAAQSLGLSSCYLASFSTGMNAQADRVLIRKLGIPDGFTPMFALSLGYANETPAAPIARREGAVNYAD